MNVFYVFLRICLFTETPRMKINNPASTDEKEDARKECFINSFVKNVFWLFLLFPYHLREINRKISLTCHFTTVVE